MQTVTRINGDNLADNGELEHRVQRFAHDVRPRNVFVLRLPLIIPVHEFAFDHLVIELLNVAPFQFFDIAVAQSGIDLIFDGLAIPLISIDLDARFAVGEKHPRQIGYGDFFALFDFVGSGIFALHDQSQNPFGFIAGLRGSDLRRLGDRQLLLLAVSVAVTI